MLGKYLQLIQQIQHQTLLIKSKAMQEDNWKYIKEFIQMTLESIQLKLDKESIDFVSHYINHDEYEMAFEGLFIEIMKLAKAPKIDFIESKKVGELLKLDEESVFDFEFWEKFEEYIKRNG
jgi:hypothetical protein